MDDRAKQAFDHARNSCGQFILLSTSVLLVLVTFTDDLLLQSNEPAKFCMYGSWVFLLVSSVCGGLALLALTGTLALKAGEIEAKAVYDRNIRIPAGIQVLSFMIGLVFLVVFAFFAIPNVQ